MLPTGHVEWTWAGLNLVQRRLGLFQEADYRIMAVAVLAPDLLDKPLAWFVFPDANAALFFGHTLLLHGFLWGMAFALGRGRRWLPYLLAFSAHLIQDRMWGFTQTLLWPLRGLSWHPWQHVGSPNEMLQAYLQILVEEPILITLDVIGAALLVWFVWDRKLFFKDRLIFFLKRGRPPADLTPVPQPYSPPPSRH
jgi:hypothetical protein